MYADENKKSTIYEHIRKFPGKSSKSIAGHFKMPVYSLNNYYIKELIKEGKVRRDRSTKVIKYYPAD